MSFRRELHRALTRLDHFLLPPLCAFCHTPLVDDEATVCGPCRADLPANEPCCPICALPLPAAPGAAPCARCQATPLPLEKVLAPLRYEFPVDAAVQGVKFRRQLVYVPVLAAAMMAALTCARLDVDLLVPVPLHHLRHGLRGFNQADELARPIARAFGLPVARQVVRVRRTARQSGLDARRRRHNVRRAFAVRGRLEANHALIIDDVMTTGATLCELARCLRAAGVPRISALVAARRAAASQAGVANV